MAEWPKVNFYNFRIEDIASVMLPRLFFPLSRRVLLPVLVALCGLGLTELAHWQEEDRLLSDHHEQALAAAATVRAALESQVDQVLLQVDDNGRGIPPEALHDTKSLGLLGMRERASVLGGEVSFAPVQPSGTRVTLRLPLVANATKFWADL